MPGFGTHGETSHGELAGPTYINLQGTVTAVATVTGEGPDLTPEVYGSLAAQASTSGVLAVVRTIGGSAAAVSTVVGTVDIVVPPLNDDVEGAWDFDENTTAAGDNHEDAITADPAMRFSPVNTGGGIGDEEGGFQGNCAVISGQSDYYRIPDTGDPVAEPVHRPTGNFTVAGRFKISGLSTTQVENCLWRKGFSGGGGLQDYINVFVIPGSGSNARIRFYIDDGLGSAPFSLITGEDVVVDGSTWNFFAAVWNPAIGKGRIYINGNVYEDDIGSIVYNNDAGSVPIQVGPATAFGYIKPDEYVFWSRALPDVSLDDIYDNGLTYPFPNYAELQGTVAATTTVGGFISKNINLYGNCVDVSVVTGAAQADKLLSGTVTATSVVGPSPLELDSTNPVDLFGEVTATTGIIAPTLRLPYVALQGTVDVVTVVTGPLDAGNLQGQVAVQASVTGALHVNRGFSATVTPAASASALMLRIRSLEGTAVGTVTITGIVEVDNRLLATVTATPTVAGILRCDRALQGTVTAVASTVGILRSTFDAIVLTGFTSVVTGALQVDRRLVGLATASSTATGLLSKYTPTSGNVAVVSTATGILRADKALSGSLAAASQATAQLDSGAGLEVSIAVAVTTAGDVRRERGLSAAVSATISATGSLVREPPLLGTVASQAGAAAALHVDKLLVGTIAAQPTTAGLLRANKPLAGAIVAAATATAAKFNLRPEIVGSLAAALSTTGSLARDAKLQGAIACQSTTSGSLGRDRAMTSSLTSTTTATAAMQVPWALQAAIAISTGVSASLKPFVALQGSVSAQTTAVGSLLKHAGFVGSIVSTTTTAGFLSRDRVVAGALQAAAAVPAAPLRRDVASFAGTVGPTSTTAGSLPRYVSIAGTVASTSTTFAAQMSTSKTFSGAVTATVVTSSELFEKIAEEMSGTVHATDSVTAAGLVLERPLAGTVSCVSTASGFLADVLINGPFVIEAAEVFSPGLVQGQRVGGGVYA